MFHIGILQFTVDIPHAASLKDKRSVIRSMKDRIRRHFNVSIAEVEDLDDVNVATMAAVMAGNDPPYINGAMDRLLNQLRDLRDGSLGDFQLEILSPH
jgi:uncharacterized protein YlxP (DUF503 family)